jgi:hypothetical protein
MIKLNLKKKIVEGNIAFDSGLDHTYYGLIEKDWIILYNEVERLSKRIKQSEKAVDEMSDILDKYIDDYS